MMKNKISQRSGFHVMLCLMFALFFSSISLSAQQFPDLVPEEVAETLLAEELPELEAALNNLNAGTPAYELAERTLNMYTHVWEFLTNDETLPISLKDAYNEFSQNSSGNPMSTDEMPSVSKNGAQYGDAAFDGLVNFLRI